MIDREFQSVVAVAQDSWLGRILSGIAAICRAAWNSSEAVRVATRVSSPLTSWPAATQLRFAALSLAWAGILYTTSVFVLPRYVVSGLPLAWMGLFVGACAIVAALPGQFVIAWRERVGPNQKSMP